MSTFIICTSNLFVYNNYKFNFIFFIYLFTYVLLSTIISIRIVMSNCIDPAVRHWKIIIVEWEISFLRLHSSYYNYENSI